MQTFRIRLAGKVIEVHSLFPCILGYCRDYLTDDKADFQIVITEQDIFFERGKNEREMRIKESAGGEFSDSYLETLAVYRKIAERMPEYGTFLFHGSAIAVDGEAYVFTAKSGTGKSTHTRLWREMFGERAVMINDDKPLITVNENGAVVHGTPWNGKHHLGNNMTVPLKAICILERDETNHIERIAKKEAYPMLLQQAYRPISFTAMLQTLRLLDILDKNVDFYRLGCNMETEAAVVSYRGMTEGDR